MHFFYAIYEYQDIFATKLSISLQHVDSGSDIHTLKITLDFVHLISLFVSVLVHIFT